MTIELSEPLAVRAFEASLDANPRFAWSSSPRDEVTSFFVTPKSPLSAHEITIVSPSGAADDRCAGSAGCMVLRGSGSTGIAGIITPDQVRHEEELDKRPECRSIESNEDPIEGTYLGACGDAATGMEEGRDGVLVGEEGADGEASDAVRTGLNVDAEGAS